MQIGRNRKSSLKKHIARLWDENVVVIDRTIDVHIRKIREKLGPNHMSKIETIKGVGYRFKSEKEL